MGESTQKDEMIEAEKPQNRIIGVKRALDFTDTQSQGEPPQKKICMETPGKQSE